MKKSFCYIICVLIGCYIAFNILMFWVYSNKELAFLKGLLYEQTINCANQIETTTFNFENDLNYLLFNKDINNIFEVKSIASCDAERIEIFYSKYRN